MNSSQIDGSNLNEDLGMIYMNTKRILNLIGQLTQRDTEIQMPNGCIEPSSGGSMGLMSGGSTKVALRGSTGNPSGSSTETVSGSFFGRGLISILSGVIGMKLIQHLCFDSM